MRVVTGLVLSMMVAFATASLSLHKVSKGPSQSYVTHCGGFGYIGGAALAPNGARAIVGGQNAFGLFDVTKGKFDWNNSFVDYGSEQEGPFAWYGSDVVVGLAPNSGTVETVWAFDIATGANTWNTGNDGSMSTLTLAGTATGFITGVVNATYASRLDSQGRVVWTAFYSDYVQSVASGTVVSSSGIVRNIDAVGASSKAYVYNDKNGVLFWNDTNLAVQATSAAIDSIAKVALFAGAADPNGANLPYTTVYGFDALSGKPLWAHNYSDFGVQSIVTANGKSFILGTNATIVLDSLTGKELWSMPLSSTVGLGMVAATPGAYNGTAVLYASTTGKNIAAINAASGDVMWKFDMPTGHTVTLSPLVTPNIVVVPTADNNNQHGFLVGVSIVA